MQLDGVLDGSVLDFETQAVEANDVGGVQTGVGGHEQARAAGRVHDGHESHDSPGRSPELSGSVEVARLSESRGRSRSSRGFESTSTQSGGSSLSWHRQQVVDPQLFRGLKADEALALLSIGRESHDAVLEMPPVYVDERSQL